MRNKQKQVLRIDKVDVGEEQKAKNGKPFNKIGIQSGDTWYNNIFFDGKHVDLISKCEGQELEVITYEEEWKDKWYQKFKLPTGLDNVEIRVATLEKRLNDAAEIIQAQSKTVLELSSRLDKIEAGEDSQLP